jgi:replication initiator protein
MNEIERPAGGKLKKDEIALMARELVLVTLPHKDPGNVPVWTRQNGNISLMMQPGYRKDPKNGKKLVCVGYPYGSIARLILYWIVTETRRTGEQKLELGRSLAEFMRRLGLKPDGSTGKRSSANSVHRQIERLIYAHIRFTKELEEGSRRGRLDFSLPVAKAACLWWDARDTEQRALWGSYLVLNDDFFKAILTQPVPVRMLTLLALKKSPLGLDLYAWATLESYKARARRQGRFVAWKLLHEQFGSELGRLDNFVAKAKRELQKIMRNCPTIRLSFERGGVQIHAGSLPDVLPRDAHDALNPPPPRLSEASAIPSSEAIEQVMSMGTTEGAMTIALKFREAVGKGKAENSDEGYISFAKQHFVRD